MPSSEPLTEERAALSLGALGNPTRLRLYRLLVRSGSTGLPVGALVRTLGAPASTLAHHLACLTRAGLVLQEQRGREVRSRPDFGAMNRLLDFLTAECCSDAASPQPVPEDCPCPDSNSP